MVWVDYQPLANNHSKQGVFTSDPQDESKVYWFPSVMEARDPNQE